MGKAMPEIAATFGQTDRGRLAKNLAEHGTGGVLSAALRSCRLAFHFVDCPAGEAGATCRLRTI